MLRKPGREYAKRGNQLVRIRQTPPARKQCIVKRNGIPCRYYELGKALFLTNTGLETVFPSKSKAQAAIWHTVGLDAEDRREFYDIEAV